MQKNYYHILNDNMNIYPKFSVSMCVYNGDDHNNFDISIGSILNQTLKPNEIVLTVDGPIRQQIKNIINKYKKILADTKIDFKVVYLKENVGHGEARRICFDKCTYDFIALMDADDISVPERFEKQMNYFRSYPEVSVVGGQIYEFIEKTENCVGKRLVPATDAEIKEYMKKRCPMNQVTVMFRKKDIIAVGGYIDWYCEEDYYLWIRLALSGKKFQNIQENLVYVRVGKEMYRRRGGWKYFKSEAKLQGFMIEKGLITLPRYILNVGQRLVLQVLMPNKLRGFIFRKFART